MNSLISSPRFSPRPKLEPEVEPELVPEPETEIEPEQETLAQIQSDLLPTSSDDEEEQWEDLPHKPSQDLTTMTTMTTTTGASYLTSMSGRGSPPRKRSRTVFVAMNASRRTMLAKKAKIHSSALASSSTTSLPATSPPYAPALPPRPSHPLPPSHPIHPPPRYTTRPVVISNEDVVDALVDGAVFFARYALDVLSAAIRLLRPPLSFLVFLWFLAIIITRLSPTLRSAFGPLCYIPGISSTAFCRRGAKASPSPSPGGGRTPQWADYPALVNVQSATFEQLLDESVGGSGLALEIKKAEMATSDLITLIRVSELRSRQVLADTLAEFVEDAKKTGRGLQRLNAKVGSAVDGILAVNDYALREIEAASSGTQSRSLASKMVWPFSSGIPSHASTNDIVTRTFTESLSVLSTSMSRLILEAETSIANLDKLEETLTNFHVLIAREDSSLSSAKYELLSELWSRLGGNKRELRGYDEHIYLLRNLGAYRKKALVHVVTALQTLQGMSEDMEELRERVAAPEVVGGRIPVEVHVRSIRAGVERLKEGRVKAKEREEEAVRRVLMIDDQD